MYIVAASIPQRAITQFALYDVTKGTIAPPNPGVGFTVSTTSQPLTFYSFPNQQKVQHSQRFSLELQFNNGLVPGMEVRFYFIYSFILRFRN